MMKRLDRYLLTELVSPFLLGIFILTFLMLLYQLLRLTELVIDKGVSLVTVADLFVRLLPSFFLLTIPMAAAFASVIAFNRLAFDNELIAFYASGISFARLIRPVFLFSLLAGGMTLLMGTLDQHWGTASFKSIAVKMLKEKAGVGLDAGRFTELLPGLMIYAESISNRTQLTRVFIYDTRNPKQPLVIAAKEGVLMANGASVGIRLLDGTMHGRRDRDDQLITFASYALKARLSQNLLETALKTPSYVEIKRQMAASTDADVRLLRLLSAFYKKFSFAYASFLFCFIGVPLGIVSGKGGRLGAFAAGIGLILLYYLLNMVGDYFVLSETLSPAIAAGLPGLALTVIVLFVFALYLNEAGPTASPFRSAQKGH